MSRRVLVPWSIQGESDAPAIVRGSGAFIEDLEGRRYLDLTSGYVCVSMGHGHPKLLAAIEAQATRLCWAPSSLRNGQRDLLADALSELSPWPGEGARAHFTSGGAEANDDAVKIARLLTGRRKVLTAYRSYHGGTLGASALTGIDRWRDRFAEPLGPRFFAPYPYRSPFHAETPELETERALAHVAQVISHEGAENIAAILIEPVTGSSSLVVPPPGYLAGLRALCDAHGILLIFDEVMTGFGRTGAAFAAQRLGVAPDLITFAKGVSGSYLPLGGVLVRESLAKHFDHAFFDVGHTHAGHVLAVATGLAALRIYREEGLYERVLTIESWLRADLDQLRQRHPIVGEVRGIGALFGLELVNDRATRSPLVAWHDPGGLAPMRAFYAELMRRGAFAYGRYNLALIAPPFTITRGELDRGIEALDGALSHIEEGIADAL